MIERLLSIEIPLHCSEPSGVAPVASICPPHFYQGGAQDFPKIDEKIGVGRGSSKSSEKERV